MSPAPEEILQEAYARLDETTRLRWDRSLALDDLVSDRWARAAQLGFGQGSSIYGSALVYGKPKVGENVWVGPQVILDSTGGLEIGNHVDISSGVMIFTHSTHLAVLAEDKSLVQREPVRIGSNVYIGSRAVIMPGVSIGDRVVVGAGSLVTKDIGSDRVAFGSPARVVGRVRMNGPTPSIEYGGLP